MSLRRLRRRLYQEKGRRSGNARTAVRSPRKGNHTAEPDNPILELQRTIGNKATTVSLQRREEEGSATMVGSAGATEPSHDAYSYTANLTDELAKGQTSSEEELMEALAEQARESKFYSDQYT